MRIARIPVGWDMFLHLLYGHDMSKMETDMPPDARVLAVSVDDARRNVFLTIESDTFDDVPEKHSIPDFNPTVTVFVNEMSAIAGLVSDRVDKAEADNKRLRNALWAEGINPDA